MKRPAWKRSAWQRSAWQRPTRDFWLSRAARLSRAAWLPCVCLLTTLSGAARADGFSVNPIHLDMRPAQSATSITVQNFNVEPLLVQVRVYRWEHRDRDDLLTEATGDDAPLVTPPLFRLAPHGASQVIRIGFPKTAVAAPDERRWRVIVEEVPEAHAGSMSLNTDAPVTVAVHVRVSVPLLQQPQTVRQDLQWTLQRSSAGRVQLTAENRGTVTERLDDIRLGAGDDPHARVTGPVYVFPGERRAFDLRPDAALSPGNVRLSVQGTPRPLLRELVLSAQ